jgi:PqqD family protein of HPr-rel-A system
MKLNKKIAISELGFVFDPTSGDSYSLNPIAVEILNMIKEEKTEAEIKTKIKEEYDVSNVILEKSVDEFLETLKDYGIVSE